MRRAALAALLASCASAPVAEQPAPAGPSGPPVRLVLRHAAAPPELAQLAAEVESEICALAAQAAGFEVVCASDVKAAAEIGQLRAALGECDHTSECVDQVTALAEGEQALSATLVGGEGSYTLTLTRAGAGGEVVRRVIRSASDAGGLRDGVSGAVSEVLAH